MSVHDYTQRWVNELHSLYVIAPLPKGFVSPTFIVFIASVATEFSGDKFWVDSTTERWPSHIATHASP